MILLLSFCSNYEVANGDVNNLSLFRRETMPLNAAAMAENPHYASQTQSAQVGGRNDSKPECNAAVKENLSVWVYFELSNSHVIYSYSKTVG